MPITKVDFVRELKELYTPGRGPALVQVPEFTFLMIDGHGDPNVSPEYGEAVEALYTVSYTLKSAFKHGPRQLDYRVMPLEGLWWVPDMLEFSTELTSDWAWTLMIRQPYEVDEDLFEKARRESAGRKKLPAAGLLRLDRLDEGKAAQVMHFGPYTAQAPTIQRLHTFIAHTGYERAGRHHEIYLGDPRRAAPEKLKTILRQPVSG